MVERLWLTSVAYIIEDVLYAARATRYGGQLRSKTVVGGLIDQEASAISALLSRRVTRDCPICGYKSDGSTLFLAERIREKEISGTTYASRKSPEFMNFRLLRCPRCTTVYAPKPPDLNAIVEAYHQAEYDSSVEAGQAAETYWQYLSPYITTNARRSALEVGCGPGVFLGKLRDAGFTRVVGVEPSEAACASSAPDIRPYIHQGILEEDDYQPASFDLCCCFMTLEHVLEPLRLIRMFERLLTPGGQLAIVVHDYNATINRLLGRKSPIIDIEHLQLFSHESIDYMLVNLGFRELHLMPLVNVYRLAYWMRLLPLPTAIKRFAIGLCGRMGISDLDVAINVGNLFCIATKPTI